MADSTIVTKKTAARPAAPTETRTAAAPAARKGATTQPAPAAASADPARPVISKAAATAAPAPAPAPAAAKAPAKKAAARKAAPTSPGDDQGVTLERLANVTPERRQEMIREAAYYKAEMRHFEGGSEAGDWAAAEREIDELLEKARQIYGG